MKETQSKQQRHVDIPVGLYAVGAQHPKVVVRMLDYYIVGYLHAVTPLWKLMRSMPSFISMRALNMRIPVTSNLFTNIDIYNYVFISWQC